MTKKDSSTCACGQPGEMALPVARARAQPAKTTTTPPQRLRHDASPFFWGGEDATLAAASSEKQTQS